MITYIYNFVSFIKVLLHSKNILINITTAFVIFFIFLLLRKVFTKYIFNILYKLTKKTKTTVDDDILNCFKTPTRVFFTILGIYFSLKYLPLPIKYDPYITKFLRISILVLVLWGAYNFTDRSNTFIKDIENRLNFKIDEILAPFIAKTLKLIIFILGVILVISELGYDISGFITGLGLGGLAFALAAKDTAANLFGGIVIIVDKPFSIGDWILTPSVEGTVEDITFRSTRVRTFAHAVVVVPNSILANEPITNWTRMGKRRLYFHIGLTYSTPKQTIQNIVNRINNMLKENDEIDKELIVTRFKEFADSSLNIMLYFFTKSTTFEKFYAIREEINYKIMDIVHEEGASFAFPSQSLYIETMPEKKEKE